MITGVVTPNRDAVVRLTVRGRGGEERVVEAVIDTGFNRYLTLPPDLVQDLGLRRIGPVQATLGDGSTRILAYYRVIVMWDRQPVDVPVLACDGGPLIGMALLYGHELRVQVIDGGDVAITALT